MIQYRVRPVTRYLVTRFEHQDDSRPGRVVEKGEYENAQTAFEVAKALCKAEHDAAGTAIDDPNFIYPRQEDMFPDMPAMSDSCRIVPNAVRSA